MGIEKFFNTLKNSYGTKIISKIESKTYYSSKILLLDFNSIIHNISQSISTSLCYLYHITLISNIKPDIFKTNQAQIKIHINNLTSDFKLNADINILEQSQTNDSNNVFNENIDFNNLNIDNLTKSFFDIISYNDNLDKLIIHNVSTYVYSLISYFPNLQYLYAAIDGVPLYAKMIQQKIRRTSGYILEEIRKTILELYKKELDIDPNINNKDDIYYNHYQFEKKIINLKFNKNKISPATQFMSDLEKYIVTFLNKILPKKIKFELDPFNKMGEGEKKIVYKIHELHRTNIILNTDLITVYSPDADVILLMLLELNKCQIQIMRYDQQLNHLDMININELHNVIINYMKYSNKEKDIQHKIISDIVMLFTLLGNDFLPKLELINTRKHIKNIFDAYLKLNISNNYIFESIINWQLLKQFFINLKQNIYYIESELYRKSLNWTLKPDQIINNNAIQFYTHIFNIENITNTYEPSSKIQLKKKYSDKIINKLNLKYLQGFIWLSKYYLEHNFDYKLYYYKYDIAPTVDQLLITIDKIINSSTLYNKLLNRLDKLIPTNYFTPATQLIYISPNNISNIIDKELINKKLIKIINEYDNNFNKELNLNIENNLINLYDYFDCTDALYLNKCNIKTINITSPKKILHLFQ